MRSARRRRRSSRSPPAVVELIVGQDAKLRYVQVQDWGRDVWNFMTERAILGR